MKHKHHIIPRHAGGTDDESNIVYLTIEEHAEAHRKLYEEYGRWQDKLAWKGLSGQIGKEEILAEIYKKRVPGHKGHKHTGDMSRFSPWKGKTLSEEHREAIRISRIGKKQPESQKQAVRKAMQKEWIITDPSGNTFDIVNLTKFARENNLDQANLHKVANGKIKQHKGYSVSYK